MAVELSDGTGWERFSAQYPSLEDMVAVLARDMETKIERLGRDAYRTCSAMTPKGNPHYVYCNGELKMEGAEVRERLLTENFSVEAQIELFRDLVTETVAAVAAFKPEGSDRLLWRRSPEFSRILRPNGLALKVSTRIGWDEI